MDYVELLKIFAPVIAAFLSVGGIGAYYAYKGNKPKNEAESQKISAETVVTFAEGWRMYAQKLETRLDENERRQQERIAKHEKDFDVLQKQIDDYRLIIRNKDERIALLEDRVETLETELSKYTKIETRSEEARETLHETVDESIEKIKRDGEA